MISKKYYLYILQSEKDGSHYVGYTTDVEKRLREHNSGKSHYTRGHRPYLVVYAETYLSKSKAKSREVYIKHYRNVKAFLKSRVPQNA